MNITMRPNVKLIFVTACSLSAGCANVALPTQFAQAFKINSNYSLAQAGVAQTSHRQTKINSQLPIKKPAKTPSKHETVAQRSNAVALGDPQIKEKTQKPTVIKPTKVTKTKTASTTLLQKTPTKHKAISTPAALWHTRANEALQTTVRRFAKQAGYQLIASDAGNKWRLMFAATHQGDFRSALNWLAAGFAEASPRPRFVLYANKVIKLEAAP